MINSTGKRGEEYSKRRRVKNKRWSEMQEKECCTGKSLREYRKRMNKKMGKEERSAAKGD